MTTITIVITDLPKGKGCTVQTNSAAPAIGRPLTPAEAVSMDLLRICAARTCGVQYGTTSAALAGELVRAQAGV